MKHLKSQFTYEEIDGQEYARLSNIPDALPSKPFKSIGPINKLLGTIIDIYPMTYQISLVPDERSVNILPRAFISELPDEWYLVKSNKRYSDVNHFYKCDQLDGLIDCLKQIYSI